MFCTITPSRDRPQFLEFCKYQLSRMTVKPDKSYFVDYPNASNKRDIIPRLQKGIELARADGFDEIFVIEDDDYYDVDYFENMKLNGIDFVGSSKSLYYNIRNLTFEFLSHPNRSSLFCTGFKISALSNFRWPEAQAVFFDLHLWRYAAKQYKKVNLMNNTLGIGIKHGVGFCGGSGHHRTLKHFDPQMEFLKNNVDKEAFEFYLLQRT